jgi:predicted amidohydrolase
MQAHLVQMDIVWEDRSANFALVESMLDTADVRDGDLVVLPELFDVGFSLNLDAAPDREGRTLAFLTSLAARRGITVHGGRAVLAEGAAKALNTAVIVGPQPGSGHAAVLCDYAKLHPFSFGRESESYTGGDRAMAYDWVDGPDTLRVCPAVCYDLRFPELFRAGIRLGAEAFAIGANWPASRQHHWRTLLLARAIENQAVVLGVNRCGNDPHLAYAGGSIAVSAKGEILGELNDRPGVLTVAVDPAQVRAWRAEFPALADVRL